MIQLAHQAGFHLQTPAAQTVKPPSGHKKLRSDNIRDELKNMDLDGITVEPGFLIDGHENAVGQLQSIIPKSTGNRHHQKKLAFDHGSLMASRFPLILWQSFW